MLDDERDFYEEPDEDEDEFSGFSIIDESGFEMSAVKKIVQEAEEDEPTIATPIPENEQIVILDNPGLILANVGDRLTLNITKESGSVFYKKMKLGDFKKAFLIKLYETRLNSFATAYLHTDSAPVMVKLVFSAEETDGSVLLV